MKNKLFIALDIDGVINSNNDYHLLSKIDNILDDDFYENIYKPTISHNKGFLNLEQPELKFDINNLESYENIIKFPLLNTYELNFSHNYIYDLKNFINYGKLKKLNDTISSYLNKNDNNECYMVIVSSWFPWDKLKSFEENNLFFKNFLEFDNEFNNFHLVGADCTSGVAQYRYDSFLKYCKNNIVVDDNVLFLYLDDINLFHKHTKPENDNKIFDFGLNKTSKKINDSVIFINENWIIPDITGRYGLTDDHFYLINDEIQKKMDFQYENPKIVVKNKLFKR